MTTIRYTEAQERAIQSRGENLLVSAAAGSGKTQVLIERIVHLVVEDRIPLDRMLVVTFTNAAAGEMKTRLAQGIQEALRNRPEDADYLAKQIRALPSAQVSTLHAYCIQTMRAYYQVIGLPADFRMASEAGQKVLQEKALEGTMDAYYQSQDEGSPFYAFVEAYGRKSSDAPIRQMIQRTTTFLRTLADGQAWLDQAMVPYRQGLGSDPRTDPFMALLGAQQGQGLQEAGQVLAACDTLLPDEGPLTAYRITLQADQAYLDDLVGCWKRQGYIQGKAKVSTLKSVSKKTCSEDDLQTMASYKALRDHFKEILKTSLGLFPEDGLARVQADRDLVRPYLDVLLELCQDYQARYQALKADRQEVDYNDLEHAMLAILQDPQAREEIRAGLDAIFFDEYQDANDIQETIVNQLAPKNGLFYVGDVKQAIYGFRFADPEIFNRRYEAYSQDQGGRVIHLADNFRSVQAILEFANGLFGDLMTPALGQVDYQAPGQALQAHRPNPDTPADHPVQVVALERDQDPMTKAEGEARWIAREAKRLVAAGEARFSDMAVLMRSPASALASYEKVFKEENIPFYSDNTTVDFSNMEVRIFHTLLQVLHNSQQDLPLASILLSPFGDLSEDDLAQVRRVAPDRFLYEACALYAQEREDHLAKKLRAFQGFLKTWRQRLTRQPVAEVAEALLETSGYSAFLIGLDQGSARLDHVLAFIDLIRDYDQDTKGGLSGFLAYANILIERQGDRLTPSIGLGAQDDRLQIMSIHKSKGLGFKVVFVSDMAKAFNVSDKHQALILSRRHGLALKVVDVDLLTTYKPLEHKLLQETIHSATLSEELRLLYVAITRAKDRLYLVTTLKATAEETLTQAAGKVEGAPGHGARSFADWVLGRLAMPPSASSLSLEAQPSHGLYHWQVVLHSELVGPEEVRSATRRALADVSLPATTQAEVSRALSFAYPFAQATQRPIKTTVTALTDQALPAGQIGPRPPQEGLGSGLVLPRASFQGDHPLYEGKEAGSLLHQVLEWIPLDIKKEDLPVLLDRYVEEGRLSPGERQALGEAQPILHFLDSDLGREIVRHLDTVRREVSFTMAYQGMIVDGQMDLVYQSADGLHVVDFKSDQRPRKDRYLGQISLYALALEKAWGQPVASATLFWLRHATMDRLGPKDWRLPEIPV